MEGVRTLNFVCYIGWAPASSVYPKQIYGISSIPQKLSGRSAITKKISADITYPKTYSPCFLFIKVWFSFINSPGAFAPGQLMPWPVVHRPFIVSFSHFRHLLQNHKP